LIWIPILLTQNVKKNTKDLVVASKETELEVNTFKTKYIFMSRDQNAGSSLNININNSSFGNVEEFKYLGTNLTNQNSISPIGVSPLSWWGSLCVLMTQRAMPAVA
jgi:hypothetical protein